MAFHAFRKTNRDACQLLTSASSSALDGISTGRIESESREAFSEWHGSASCGASRGALHGVKPLSGTFLNRN
jgi:hypothetical protein